MNLKKSDKMIAGIAVIVLIIAAIGIIMYMPEDGKIEDDSKTKEFKVEWIRGDPGHLTVDETVGADGYTEPFTVTATGSDRVITKVDVLITWEDGHSKNGLLNKGLDTIATNIGLAGEDLLEYTTDTGIGNKTLTFSVFNKPQDKTIEDVKDLNEAEQMISDEYDNMDSANFDVVVTWTKGEKFSLRLGRLLNFFGDKGEDFKFEITFEYYYPYVYDVNEDNDDDDEYKGTNLKMKPGPYTITSYGGRV